MAHIFRPKSFLLMILMIALMILGSISLAQDETVSLSADQLMLSSVASANSDFSSPVQLSWFYKPPKDGSSMSYLANNFDFYVLTKNDESQRDYLQDQGYLVMQYTRLDVVHDPCFQADDPQGTTCNCSKKPLSNQVAWFSDDICYIRDNHRDWFLRDKNGNLIYSIQGNQDEIIMDPGRKGWRDFWLSRIQSTQATGWDGVFLDNMGTTFTRHGGDPVDLRDYTRQEWRNTVADYLRYVRRGYFEGAGKKMFSNLSVYWNEDDTYFQFLQYLDGTMDEHWAVLGNDAGVYSQLSWERRILRADATLAQGKEMILVSRGARSDSHRRNFAMASYLLVDRGNSYFRYSRQGDYDKVWLYDDYDIPLGNPVGTYYKSGSNWVRNFENGRVSVNPSAYTYSIDYNVAPPQIFGNFSLVQGGTDNVIRQMSSGITLTTSEATDANFRVSIANGDPGDVTMTLSGPTNIVRVERYSPFSLIGDYGKQTLAPGSYTLSATSSNDPLNPLVVSFTVGSSSANQAPSVSITTDKSSIQNSDSSVTFSVTASASDPDGTVASYHWSNGSNGTSTSVTVAPGNSTTLSVYVTDNDGANSNTASITLQVNAATVSGPRISSLTWIDATQDIDVGELRNGTNWTWPQAQNFSIRANIAGGDPGTVEFHLRGRVNYDRTERYAVYAIFGDNGPDYYGGNLRVGQYSLEVVPTNNPAGAVQIDFDVVSSSPREFTDVYSSINWQLPAQGTFATNAEYYNIVFTDADFNIVSDEWYEASSLCLEETCGHVLARNDMPQVLTNGSYSWWMRSWSADTDLSDWSDEGALVISAPMPVLVPLTMTTDNGKFELTWAKDPNVEWLQIYIGTSEGSQIYREWIPTTDFTCTENICSFEPDAIPSEGNYQVYFQAWGLGGFAGGTPEFWNGPNIINVSGPYLPRNLDVWSNSHTLSWSAAEGATEYEIWVGTITPQTTAYMERRSAESLGCQNANTCVLDLNGVVQSGQYVWYVRAWNSAGASQGGVGGWAVGPTINW